MLALDFHAHIDPKIHPSRLCELGSCIVAVTRSLSEFALVAERSEENVTWALGAHPADPLSLEEFPEKRLQSLIETVPVVGEVGLDRRSPVPLARQQDTLGTIFRILGEQPRILNIHSAGATAPLLKIIEKYRPSGVVLHWWRGTPAQTDRALHLGCSFSVNAAEVARPKILQMLPRERVVNDNYSGRFTPITLAALVRCNCRFQM